MSFGISTPKPKSMESSFMAKVMWLSGFSIGNISIVMGRSTGSVRGIINRAFDRSRESMTLEERQAELDRLKEDRRDDGKIPDKFFAAHPLKETQVVPKTVVKVEYPNYRPVERPAKQALPPVDPKTREGRKELQRRKREADYQRREEAAARLMREQGKASRGEAAAALEYLYSRGLLSDPEERRVDARPVSSLQSKERRKEAGRILRSYIDGSRVGGMTAIDLDRVGTGSNSRLSIPEHRLRSMSCLGAVRKMLGDIDYEMLEAIVDRDDFPWGRVNGEKARAMVYEDIRRQLDVVAVHERLMDREDFKKRWDRILPDIRGLDRDGARAKSDRAEEVLRQAV